jgi:plasmid maintenance system killer protein
VELDFSSNSLIDASLSFSEASRLFGVPIGRKYIQRLAILRAVENFTQLYGFQALKLHPLKGNRSEQYAIILTANYRLIIEKIKENKVRIVDVEDYHGD